jgi:hypothetical protein
MTKLNEKGVAWFKANLLEDNTQKILTFERATMPTPENDLARVYLYDQRSKILRHFELSDSTVGAFFSETTHAALVGKVREQFISTALTWQEKQSHRFNIHHRERPDLVWEQDLTPPKARLTDGRLTPKVTFQS